MQNGMVSDRPTFGRSFSTVRFARRPIVGKLDSCLKPPRISPISVHLHPISYHAIILLLCVAVFVVADDDFPSLLLIRTYSSPYQGLLGASWGSFLFLGIKSFSFALRLLLLLDSMLSNLEDPFPRNRACVSYPSSK